MADTPECIDCGVCCFSQLTEYVSVSGDDYARLGTRAAELAQFDGTHAFMRMGDGHCGALERDAESGQFGCNAYLIRPETCRELVRGSSACGAERHAKHARPLLMLRREPFSFVRTAST